MDGHRLQALFRCREREVWRRENRSTRRRRVDKHLTGTPPPENVSTITAGLLAHGSLLLSGLPDDEHQWRVMTAALRLQLRGQHHFPPFSGLVSLLAPYIVWMGTVTTQNILFWPVMCQASFSIETASFPVRFMRRLCFGRCSSPYTDFRRHAGSFVRSYRFPAHGRRG